MAMAPVTSFFGLVQNFKNFHLPLMKSETLVLYVTQDLEYAVPLKEHLLV